MTDDALISVSALSHQYGDRTVMSVEKWALEKGQHQVLQGPSGSGKTTFLSVLTGLLRPTGGEVTLMGQRIDQARSSTLDALRARSFGIVFQDNHLVSSLTLEANLKLTQRLAMGREDTAWTDHLLDQLGLLDRKHSKPGGLSRGEAQRAAIVRAASTKPPILIADEPTSALDDQNTTRVLALLRSLAEEAGSTLLVATHDGRVASEFDRKLDFAAKGEGV